MTPSKINWDAEHILIINREVFSGGEADQASFQKSTEPWLSAIFQSEHLSLLTGTGLTTAVSKIADPKASIQAMARIEFETCGKQIKKHAEEQAKEMGRGEANAEDDFRTALEMLKGYQISGNKKEAIKLEKEINQRLSEFINSVLSAETGFVNAEIQEKRKALNYLQSFLISFASRTATRDRLNIFTTNYDRFIEYGCDKAGIITMDRFVGRIEPIFRTTKLELDYHYNPPGIRGEPRYIEGVVRLTKLHGSIDWRFKDKQIIRTPLPFGVDSSYPLMPEKPKDHFVIYPNSSKEYETTYYPYSELFRDFSAALCRPNSSLITYGYGFGDSHINRILEDMLTIPSTHIVIISFDKASDRIKKFYENNNPAQFTLLIGKHFGNLETLIDNYLPKAAIDRISKRKRKIEEDRGDTENGINDDMKKDENNE